MMKFILAGCAVAAGWANHSDRLVLPRDVTRRKFTHSFALHAASGPIRQIVLETDWADSRLIQPA